MAGVLLLAEAVGVEDRTRKLQFPQLSHPLACSVLGFFFLVLLFISICHCAVVTLPGKVLSEDPAPTPTVPLTRSSPLGSPPLKTDHESLQAVQLCQC
jgi:hypothetical protein